MVADAVPANIREIPRRRTRQAIEAGRQLGRESTQAMKVLAANCKIDDLHAVGQEGLDHRPTYDLAVLGMDEYGVKSHYVSGVAVAVLIDAGRRWIAVVAFALPVKPPDGQHKAFGELAAGVGIAINAWPPPAWVQGVQ